MTTPVRPSSFTQQEVDYYARRYEAEVKGLGERLWQDIQAAVARIAEHPDVGQVVPRTRNLVRRVPLRRFPFFLIYRRRDDFLEIIALAHTSRRPNYWRSRLKFD